MIQEAKELLHVLKSMILDIEQGDLVKIIEFNQYLEKLLEFYKKNLENSPLKELFEKWKETILKKSSKPQNLKQILESLEKFLEFFTNYLQNQENLEEIKNFLSLEIQDNQFDSQNSFYSNHYFQGIVQDSHLLRKFYYEAIEHLESIQSLLIEIEFDPTNSEFINTIFRDIHTIKGSSSFLGLKNFEEVSHAIEELLSKVRDKKIVLNKDLIDIIFLGTKIIRTLLDILILEVDSKDFSIDALVRCFEQINIFPFVNFMKNIISKIEIKRIGEILQEEGKLQIDEIQTLLEKQSKTKELFGTLALKEGIIEKKDLDFALKKQKQIKKRISDSHYVKVASTKLNTLVDLVGELVINQSIVKQQILEIKHQHKIDFSEKTIQQLDHITSMIKNIVLTLGMLPIQDIFNKLKVATRNIANELKKIVVLETEGDETELDRSVIEILYEPLLHLLRNSIDHGIEEPEIREKKQKPKIGKIFLKAENKGSEIWISIKDDGRGIQKQKILTKAIEKNLIPKEKINHISDKEIYDLMFIPGLSTKDQATNISGRGVGLDVVKKALDSINGRIEVESVEDQYTKFLLKLPLTLAIIEGFVVLVKGIKYVIPFNYLEEIFIFKPEDIIENQNLIDRRGTLIPVYDLFSILVNSNNLPKRDFYQSLIVKYENKLICIIVDEIIGKQEVVIRNLGILVQNKKFSGGTIFGDGNIGFVLDMEGFLSNII